MKNIILIALAALFFTRILAGKDADPTLISTVVMTAAVLAYRS